MSRPDPALIVVLALVAAVFARALGGDFVYDDLVLVARNPGLNDPFALRALIAEPLYGAEQGYWRPLTTLLLAWGKALDQGGPTVLHALALALHLGAVAQASALGRSLGLTRGAALGGALLFGVCPVVVEPVSWVAAINDPLWAFCALGALRAHLRWRTEGTPGLPLRAAAWLAAGLLAKENALSIGLLLLALDACIAAPSRPDRRAMLRSYGTYAAIAVVWFALRAAVLGDVGLAIAGAAAQEPLAQPFARRVEILGRLAMAVIWPQDPTPFRTPAEPLELGSAEFRLAAGVGALLIALALVALARRWRPVAFAALAFFAVAVPIAARPQALGAYPIADRYLYLSACTASLAFAWIVQRWLREGTAVPLLLLLIAVPYGIDSIQRIAGWSDQATLIAAGLTHHPGDPRLEYMAGRLALEGFSASGETTDLDSANAHFDRATRLLEHPQWGGEALVATLRADVALGRAWCALGAEGRSPVPRWDGVVARFEQLAAAYPGHAPAQLGLGVALASAGRLPAAGAAFERALVLDPHLTEALVNLARVAVAVGDRDAALRHLDAALRQRPEDAQARAMREALAR